MRKYEHLDVSIIDDVFRIAFDRPDSQNAVDAGVHRELTTVFSDAYESDTRVVLLTGNGDSFAAGGDLDWLEGAVDDPAAFQETIREGEEIVEDVLNLEKPLVAKVNGNAIGVGATLALLSDIIYMSDDARIGDLHTNVGIAAGDGGALIWPLLTSMVKAKEILMTGALLTADEAEELGLVNYVVPSEELDAAVDGMIDDLATGPQTAIRYTKMILNGWLQLGANATLREGLALEGLSQQREDHREGLAAFRDGRPPEYPSGRE